MKTPKGTKDSLPQEERLKQLIIEECENGFKNAGAERIDTPSFELYSVLMDKYGDNEKEIFVLETKNGEKENGETKENKKEKCALRYDLTVPFSRYVKTHKIDKMKRYQIGKVFRRDKPSLGRYREFTQCDYDALGYPSNIFTDIETLCILNNILKNLRNKYNLPKYIIKINSKQILYDILNNSKIPEILFSSITSSIDKLDKTSWDEVSREMKEKGLNDEQISKLGSSLQNACLNNERTDIQKENMDYIKSILEYFQVSKTTEEKSETTENCIELDLTLARGLDYYTGIIFEVKISNDNKKKEENGKKDEKNISQYPLSVCGGGRYNTLCSKPCIGFSIGVDRLVNFISVKEERPFDVWIISFIDDIYVLQILQFLREKNIRVGSSLEKVNNPKKQLKYASDNNIPFVIIIDNDVKNEKKIQLKNLITREQKILSLEESLVSIGGFK